MASSESLPMLSDATEAAIHRAVDSVLEALSVRVINDIIKQLQPDVHQRQADNLQQADQAQQQQEVPSFEVQVQSEQGDKRYRTPMAIRLMIGQSYISRNSKRYQANYQTRIATSTWSAP